MKIREFLRDRVFTKRLEKNPALVIYDPASRYRGIIQGMAGTKRRVIEVAETVIVPREEAIQGLQDLARGEIDQLLVWIKCKAPVEAHEKIQDLFAVLAAVGSVFPDGDGDQFRSISLRAFPTHQHDIEALFQDGEPTFEMIDALEGGTKYPQLTALLETSSTKEMLLRLLVPTPRLEECLKGNAGWVGEARSLIAQSLGHTVKTKGETRHSIASELWQVLLISEFALDAEEALPPSLAQVPRAEPGAKALVYDLCHELRSHADYRSKYLEAAQRIEADYQLPTQCQDMKRLGCRDTFSFEERFLFKQAVEAISAGQLAIARQMAVERLNSVWKSLNDDAGMRWGVLEQVIELLAEIAELPMEFGKSLEDIADFYVTQGRKVDKCHRQVEQIVARGLSDGGSGIETLINKARQTYRSFADRLQGEFVKRVVTEGWAPPGSRFLRNNQVFDQVVKPLVDSNERVGLILLDSLRLELGVELQKQLQEKHTVELRPIWAQLPTYTEIGMASLMPDAANQLKLKVVDGTLVTHLGGQPATNPTSRFDYLKTKLGDRCQQIELDALTGVSKPPKFGDQVRLILVRSHELDSTAHASLSGALSYLPDLLRKVLFGLSRLAEMGLQKAVIATDHGFIINPNNQAGNLVTKPKGQWLVQKPRCLIGNGMADDVSLVLQTNQVGIPAECQHYAVPRTLGTYEKGHDYFHEGLSPQEALLPCLVVALKGGKDGAAGKPKLNLSYRGNRTFINTRTPNFELENRSQPELYQSTLVEVAVEAIDVETGKVVGEVSTGPTVNMANKCVRLEAGQKVSFTLRMELDFEGSFKVRVYDPSTQITHTEKTMKTEYLG